jgi:CubicO group peptidase (beta-lactamase class C family)
MYKRLYIGCIVAILFLGTVQAGSLPLVKPDEVGFSAQRLAYIDQFYADKVEKGELAGAVTLIARHGKIVHFTAVGFSGLERKRKMQRDIVFRAYSMTKPVTAVALMLLHEEGRFQRSDPLSKYIAEFAHLNVLRTPHAALDDVVHMGAPMASVHVNKFPILVYSALTH